MTNKEKFKEVFEKTFGFVPEDHFPCPEKCPDKFKDGFCDGCSYYEDFESKEYKKPKTEKDSSDFLHETAGIMNNLALLLIKHSPIKGSDLLRVICTFMDVVTNDSLLIDSDIAGVRMDLAEKIYKEWPHPVEYYKKGEKA